MFAFMVIGLNGKIPLNTAGNLAGRVGGVVVPPGSGNPSVYGGPSSASHLGNSMSEVDPTYALQNAFNPTVLPSNPMTYVGDPLAAFAPPQVGATYFGMTNALANNTQVDNAGIDVRLTQLRNLLAGTRTAGNGNGESNAVFGSTGPNSQGVSLPLPNGIADVFDIGALSDANTGLPYVPRTSAPIAGRWGEAQSIPGGAFPNPAPAQVRCRRRLRRW